MKPGNILIASPKLPPPFFQTLVLILKEENGGHMGVILTRPSPFTLHHVWKETNVPNIPENLKNHTLHWGGPMKGPLIAVHDNPKFKEETVCGSLYMTANKNEIQKLVATNSKFRIFTGYSGWGQNQLDYELRGGAWLNIASTSKLQEETIFGDSATSYDLWETVKNQHNQESLSRLGIKAKAFSQFN